MATTPAADAALHTSVDGSTASAQTQQDDITAAAQCQISEPSSSSMASANTRRSKSITLYAANSIGHHYFGSQQQLEVIAEPSKMTGSASTQKEINVDPPPRVVVRTKLYINAVVVAVLVGVLGWSYYTNISAILRLQHWYALIMIAVIPVGITFFGFAVSISVTGIFSLFVGEWWGARCVQRSTDQQQHSNQCSASTVAWQLHHLLFLLPRT
jgi:hypothetical protein